MTPQELKNSILQQAIQGKLVEQRPEEGTAEELYQQIQAEKKRLIAEKKIKKGKPLPEITEEEKPFEIPESWKWVRLPEIATSSLGKTLDKAKNTGSLHPYLCSINVYWSGISLEKVKEAKFEDEELSKYRLKKGDLLICEGGEIGRSCVWNFDDEMYYQNALHRVRFIGNICPYYFQYLLECYKYMGILNQYSKGMTIKHLVQTSLHAICFPLPPLAEQKRIVAKIEELLPLIDRYEAAWSRLEDFNKRFPEDMQKSILQQAIQGKLVEQRPEEGTAEELYQQIQAEKKRLIAEKKIKKEKPLPEITEEEKPFEIPESWKWVSLSNITWFLDAGKSPKCDKIPVSGVDWGVITTTAIQNGRFDETQNKILPSNFEVKPSMQIKESDILITRAGPTNRTGIACVVKDIRYNLILSDKTLRINMTDHYVDKDYIVWVLNSPPVRKLIIELMSGMDKQQVNISQDKYKTLPIPLPPLAEQKRIVAKIEQLLPLCERLK